MEKYLTTLRLEKISSKGPASQTPAASQPVEPLPQTSPRSILYLANFALLVKPEDPTIRSTIFTIRHITQPPPSGDGDILWEGIDRNMLVEIIKADLNMDVGKGGL